jgi:hypothetical protein
MAKPWKNPNVYNWTGTGNPIRIVKNLMNVIDENIRDMETDNLVVSSPDNFYLLHDGNVMFGGTDHDI